LHRQPAKAEVVTIAIDLADARHQVMQVRLGALNTSSLRVQFLRPPFCQHWRWCPICQAGTMCSHSMRAARLAFCVDVAAGFQVHAVAGVFAAAIELGGLWGVELPGDFLASLNVRGAWAWAVKVKNSNTQR
jgi:hypothetical protein